MKFTILKIFGYVYPAFETLDLSGLAEAWIFIFNQASPGGGPIDAPNRVQVNVTFERIFGFNLLDFWENFYR